MNAKISVLATCVKAIIYLLLHNMHGSTFNDSYLKTLVRDQAPTATETAERVNTLKSYKMYF